LFSILCILLCYIATPERLEKTPLLFVAINLFHPAILLTFSFDTTLGDIVDSSPLVYQDLTAFASDTMLVHIFGSFLSFPQYYLDSIGPLFVESSPDWCNNKLYYIDDGILYRNHL
jgi:hypothetical protein